MILTVEYVRWAAILNRQNERKSKAFYKDVFNKSIMMLRKKDGARKKKTFYLSTQTRGEALRITRNMAS